MPWRTHPSRVERSTRRGRYVSSLTRLPAEAANRCKQPDYAPHGDGGERRAGVPEVLVADHHVARQPGEVGQRQHVRDRLEEAWVAVRGEERPGDDCHRQVDEV